jgi:hypothetical protein
MVLGDNKIYATAGISCPFLGAAPKDSGLAGVLSN